jgi:TnpA family transposase
MELNRLEDQELAMLSLHLLHICLVYINTLMIQQVFPSRSGPRRRSSIRTSIRMGVQSQPEREAAD